MTVITSNTVSSNANASVSSAITQTVDISSTAVADTSLISSTTEAQDSVEISTRTQKLKMLNDEFFSGETGSFELSVEFIDRLEEYGFLNSSEAERLTGGFEATDESSALTELSSFIDGLLDEMEGAVPQNAIFSVLEQAKMVIDNFDDPTAESSAINISSIVEQLKGYSASVSGQMPQTDQDSLDQLVLTLSIANLLTPSTSSSSEIDNYLAISNLGG